VIHIVFKLPHFAMAEYTYHNLRRARLDKSTKPFNARGARLLRCERCLLGENFCICAQISPVNSTVDWLVLMHPDEVLKPTNTGRLLADLFPRNTWVFEWSRTVAPEGLLTLLQDPQRYVVMVFPAESCVPLCTVQSQANVSNLRLTLILLDGTWKQARKMCSRTPWLSHLQAIELPPQATQYGLRKTVHEGSLSTAEAAIGLLQHLDPPAAQSLQSVFVLFNQGYMLSRGLRPDQC
jgi:DTW domain-containing protein